MRSSAIRYLNSIADAKALAEKPFDKAISHYRSKEKDNPTAAELTDEKRRLFGRRLLGTWRFPKYSVPLYSDGTAGPDRSWTLENAGMVIFHRTLAAPKGVWVDKGVIGVTGKTCQIKNQLGHVKNGVLLDPAK